MICVVSLGLLAVAAAIGSSSAGDAPTPLPLGIHLLTDAQYLAETTNLTFKLGTVHKNLDAPFVVPQYPWETAVQFYTALLTVPPPDGALGDAPSFILYYACANDTLFFNNVSVCVANSSDGQSWSKPLLPYYPFDAGDGRGPLPTNRVFSTDVNCFFGSVILDSRPGTPPAERFKMVYEGSTHRYAYIAVSPDGYRWDRSVYPDPVYPTGGYADTQLSLIWDAAAGVYSLYGRNDSGIANTTRQCPGGYAAERWVLSTQTQGTLTDPTGWGPARVELAPGAPDPLDCTDNYNPAGALYHDSYFLFPSSFFHIPANESGAPDSRAGGNDGYMDIRLMASRTGRNFTFKAGREPLVARGVGYRDPASGLYNGTGSERDAGFVFMTAGGILDSAPLSPWVTLVYWGSQTTHAGGGAYLYRYWPGAFTGIFGARVRREGLVGLSTSQSDPWSIGTFTTDPLLLPVAHSVCQPCNATGATAVVQLALNVETGTAGSVTAVVLDASTGLPVPGYTAAQAVPLRGNYIRMPLSWSDALPVPQGAGRTDLSPLAGSAVQVSFTMQHATLWSWELRCACMAT